MKTTQNSDYLDYRGQPRIGTFVRGLQFLRKEVNNMKTYSKPDVAVLGDAVPLIQGSKPIFGDAGQVMHPSMLNDAAD
jgi:hypothetical protein